MEKIIKAKLISKVYDEMENILEKYKGNNMQEQKKDIAIEDKEKNTKYEAGSNCFEIAHDKSKGRHALATRNINIGEVILIEKPITCALLPGKLS